MLPFRAALALEPGLVIGGSYRVEQQLGRGAMGEVWAGVRLTDGLRVAIKVLQTAAAARGEVVARFRREAQVLERVRSEYVARVIDFSSDATYGLLLILELIPGESLLNILHRKIKLNTELALEVGLNIARGLHDLHSARIVHRDLKPGNVVLQPLEGHQFRAVLIDFGISRILSGPEESGEEVTAITRAGTVLGTLEYIAPEQVFGSQTVTGTADLYALGAILYRAIAGHHAFVANADAALLVLKMTGDPPPIAFEVPGPIADRTQALVSKLLARDPGARYQTAAEVVTEIESILGVSYEDTEFPTGVRSKGQPEEPSTQELSGSDLAPAVEPDEEDATAAQILVDWESDVDADLVEVDEHTTDDEIKTIFLPPQRAAPTVPRHAVMVQPQVLMDPSPLAYSVDPRQVAGPIPTAGNPAPASRPMPQQGIVQSPGAQSVSGLASWSNQPQPQPASPQAPAQQWTPPVHRPLPQSAIETVHIQAYRPSRSRWTYLAVAIVLAALAGAVLTWLVLPQLLGGTQ